jgi:hypothetical protein
MILKKDSTFLPDHYPIWLIPLVDDLLVHLSHKMEPKKTLMLDLNFFNALILVWPVPLAHVLPRPQLIFPSKTWFFGIYLNFQQQKSLKNQYLPHSESKFYQINSIKSCSSRSFQQHQRRIPIPAKFSVKKSFNIQELLHHKSKRHGTKPMHPSSSRAFQR